MAFLARGPTTAGRIRSSSGASCSTSCSSCPVAPVAARHQQGQTMRMFQLQRGVQQQQQEQRRDSVACCASSPDTEEARSPLDAPQEWEPPQPSRRPDIFPEFEKMDRVFLPKPLPGDPEMPDEEMEEARKRTEPGDPNPEQKPGEPAEPEEAPTEPGSEPEKRGTDIPNSPE